MFPYFDTVSIKLEALMIILMSCSDSVRTVRRATKGDVLLPTRIDRSVTSSDQS